MYESNDFGKFPNEIAQDEREKETLNNHLTRIEKEIYQAIKYKDYDKFDDLVSNDGVNLHFKIEVTKD